jgi:hypothetical protein
MATTDPVRGTRGAVTRGILTVGIVIRGHTIAGTVTLGNLMVGVQRAARRFEAMGCTGGGSGGSGGSGVRTGNGPGGLLAGDALWVFQSNGVPQRSHQMSMARLGW